MMRKTREFCPDVDAVTLLQFRSEAFRAWLASPAHQDEIWQESTAPSQPSWTGRSTARSGWMWIQGGVSGERPVARYDGQIKVMSSGDNVSATWVFDRGLPMKVRGPELNAKTGEVAIEELHIAHEGLRFPLAG